MFVSLNVASGNHHMTCTALSLRELGRKLRLSYHICTEPLGKFISKNNLMEDSDIRIPYVFQGLQAQNIEVKMLYYYWNIIVQWSLLIFHVYSLLAHAQKVNESGQARCGHWWSHFFSYWFSGWFPENPEDSLTNVPLSISPPASPKTQWKELTFPSEKNTHVVQGNKWVSFMRITFKS